MEPPECPVCLQFYDGATTIPRVLPCGHSACEVCLNQLHHPHPHTIHCPACTQLVKFPHPGGASALPKNIDLLRLSFLLLEPDSNNHPSNLNSRQPNQDPATAGRPRFVPQVWSYELYSAWKDWVLPRDAVLINAGGDQQVGGVCSVLEGKLRIISRSVDFTSFSPLRSRLKDWQKVSLLKIGDCELDEGAFEYSYVGRVMGVLNGMRESERTELGLVLDVSLRRCKVCDVYGLWFDAERRSLYVVSERKDASLLKLIDDQGGVDGRSEKGITEMLDKDQVSYLMMIGLEICEALMGLQLQGFCFGCLGLRCFVLDEFGHVHVDLSEAVLSGRKICKWVANAVKHKQKSDNKGAKELIADLLELDAFASPELLFKLLGDRGVQVGDAELESMAEHLDVWLLACIFLRLLKGKQLADEMFNYLNSFFQATSDEAVVEPKVLYMAWLDKLAANLEASLGSEYVLLHDILYKCLEFDPGSWPSLADVWKSIRSLISMSLSNVVVSFNGEARETSGLYCLALGELCYFSDEIKPESRTNELRDGCDDDKEVLNQVWEEGIERDKVLPLGKVKCAELEGHLDCVTGFCVGGGFLFSSSFDKTIIVWSLQDFARVHTFRGHDHRVMAVSFVDGEQPMCISGDNGGGICMWRIGVPFEVEPSKNGLSQKIGATVGSMQWLFLELNCSFLGVATG
ncbi:hypothetical protein Dimus_005290 [Dionaea muscipula]